MKSRVRKKDNQWRFEIIIFRLGGRGLMLAFVTREDGEGRFIDEECDVS